MIGGAADAVCSGDLREVSASPPDWKPRRRNTRCPQRPCDRRRALRMRSAKPPPVGTTFQRGAFAVFAAHL